MNIASLITGPIFKYVAVIAIAWLVVSVGVIKYLWSANATLNQQISVLETDNKILRGYNKASEDARLMAEEQCEARCEALRNRPTEEIDPDAEIDDSLLDRIRRGGWLRHHKDRDDSGATGKGADHPAASGKTP